MALRPLQQTRPTTPLPRLHYGRPACRGAGPPLGRRGHSLPDTLRLRQTPHGSRQRTQALLSSDWGVWAGLSACGAAAKAAETTRLGQYLSAPLTAILLGLLSTSCGLLPASSGVYDAVWAFAMPLASALYLLEADLREAVTSAGTVFQAFIVASLAALVGTVVAWVLFGWRLGPQGYKVASALCASYVGGSVNFAAVAAALPMPSSLVAGAMVADNVAMAAYLAILSVYPASAQPSPRKAVAAEEGPATGKALPSTGLAVDPSAAHKAQHNAQHSVASGQSMGLALTAAAASCALGDSAGRALGLESAFLGFAALAASGFSAVGSAVARQQGREQGSERGDARGGDAGVQRQSPATPFAGAEALAGAIMLLFLAAIGTSAGSLSSLASCGPLGLFIAAQLSIQLGLTLGVSRALGLPTAEVLTAANAAVGGSGTAAAMAAARGWPQLVRPGVLCGSLGYAIGTPLGLLMAQLLQGIGLLELDFASWWPVLAVPIILLALFLRRRRPVR